MENYYLFWFDEKSWSRKKTSSTRRQMNRICTTYYIKTSKVFCKINCAHKKQMDAKDWLQDTVSEINSKLAPLWLVLTEQVDEYLNSCWKHSNQCLWNLCNLKPRGFFKYSFAYLHFSSSDSQSLGFSYLNPPKTFLDKSMKALNESKARGKGAYLVLNVPRHESSGITKTKQKGYSSTTKQCKVCKCSLKKCTCVSIIQFLQEDLAQLWGRFSLPNNFILYIL